MTNQQREVGQLYSVARRVLDPLFSFAWNIEVVGAENIPAEGGAIIAPNHLSVIDHFVVGTALPRRITYVGKAEYMDLITSGKVLHLGTYNGNPLVMAAVKATSSEACTRPVVEATVGLRPIETSLLKVDSDRVPDFDTLLSLLLEGGRKHQYSVAWVDSLAKGRALGRAVLDQGDFATLDDLPPRDRRRRAPLAYRPLPSAPSLPVAPNNLLNRATIAAFNEFKTLLKELSRGSQPPKSLELEAQRGIVDERVRRTRLPSGKDTLAGEALRTNKAVRASRQPGEDEIRLKTGYFVSAIVYVPVALGGVTFGVLSAAHREPGMQFSAKDERLLEAIADFAAIAIQNARQYKRTDAALERRVKEVSALNQLTFTLSSSLNLDKVYDVLVEQVNRHWPVEAVELYLIDDENERLMRHRPGPGNTGVAYYAMRDRWVNGIVGEAVFATPFAQWLQGIGMDPVISVPS